MDLFCDARLISGRYEGHIRELERLFVFHGLSCGRPESFGALGAKLAESRAFRTDVSAVARGVRDSEGGGISAEEMLTMIALAIGGRDVVEGRAPAVGVGNAVSVLWVLLDAIGGWRETDSGEVSIAAAARGEGAGRSAVGEGTAEANGGLSFVEPAGWGEAGRVRDGAESRRVGEGGAPEGAGPAGVEVELAIRELKVYLEDIDRRICRLEPHVEDLSQTVRESRERLVTVDASALRSAAGEVGGVGSEEGNTAEVANVGHFSRGLEAISRERESVPAAPPEEETAVRDRSGLMNAIEPAKIRGEVVDWRRVTGLGLRVAALVFGMIGLVGLARMSKPFGTGAAAEHGAPAGGGGALKDPTVARAGEGAAPVPASVVAAPTTAPSPVSTLPAPVVVAGPKNGTPEGGRKGDAVVSRRAEMTVRPTPAVVELPAGRDRAGVASAGTRLAEKKVELSARADGAEGSRGTEMATKETVKAPVAAPVLMADAPVVRAEAHADNVAAGTTTAEGAKPVVEVRSAGGQVMTSRRPVYPAEALRAHREATVVLNAFLAKDGTVRRMDVVRGAYGFNRSAMDAVWGWRYKPMVVHGQAVEGETQITVDYRMH